MVRDIFMKKQLLYLFLLAISTLANADNPSILVGEEANKPAHPNSTYISRQAYIQNPYLTLPSLGGNQNISESAYDSHSVARKWFGDGTWNVLGQASYMGINGSTNIGYGANIFAQTGSAAGFSFGGLLTVMNPAFSEDINTNNLANQAQTLPIDRQITPQELFVEYRYSNIVQADAGWIGINNSPWLTYYQNNTLTLVTYQGAVVNVNPGGGWLLTALAINGAQLVGQNGFSGLTMYNPHFNRGTRADDVGDQATTGTIALGANWATPQNLYNLRVWGYDFMNYTRMLYTDSTINLDATDNLKFSIGVQGAIQDGDKVNILNAAGYGESVQSNMVGLQLGFSYHWFGVQLAYNNTWGPETSFEGGGLISPYTYEYGSDPLYTTSYMQGLVEKSAGQAFKIATPLTFLDNNLTFYPSVAYYATTAIPASTEYNFVMSYSIPQVKGFTIFGAIGQLDQSEQQGGNVQQIQLMLSYLY
jgi:hypothetical protein